VNIIVHIPATIENGLLDSCQENCEELGFLAKELESPQSLVTEVGNTSSGSSGQGGHDQCTQPAEFFDAQPTL
jgi:hypothetical protein